MSHRLAKVATAVTGVAFVTQIQSYAEKVPATNPWFKGAGAEIQVDQVGQQVKKTKQADGGVHIEGNPEALTTLENVSENTNQYGLAAIKVFADAQKYVADAAAAAQQRTDDALKYSADAAAAAQKHTSDAAAAAQKHTSDSAAAAQQRTDDAQKYVAKCHKEEVQWLGTVGFLISIIVIMKSS
jgi:autonomous glycyl radical cofactor GrcA